MLARVMFTGDPHLSDRNYGGHVDYPGESLYYETELSSIAKERGVTHYVCLGDFSFGRFHSLEFRDKVDKLIEERTKMCSFYMVKGNHDKMSSGMSEYEYYLKKGMFNDGSEALNIGIGLPGGGLHVEFKNYNDVSEYHGIEGAVNILATHGLFVFKGSTLPNYGTAQAELDDFTPWASVDMIISGHIHNEHFIKGKLCGKEVGVHYLPCLSRPAYIKGGMADIGHVDIVTVEDDGSVNIESVEIPLLPVEQCFNLEAINAQKEHKEKVERQKIDISDIVQKMAGREMNFGDPVQKVEAMDNIDLDVKKRAIELLKEACG